MFPFATQRHSNLVETKKNLNEKEVILDCGWGCLIFANTFQNPMKIAEVLLNEKPGKRDIAIFIEEPHVVLSMAPQEIFLDPSHHLRLLQGDYLSDGIPDSSMFVRKLDWEKDSARINQIYQSRCMVQVEESFFRGIENSEKIVLFVAVDSQSGQIEGVITCLDHGKIYNDPGKGVSLWSLAVDPQTSKAGVGEKLVRYCAEQYFQRDRNYIDLSVLHNNEQAINLYEKLGFQKIPLFFLKNKSAINEKLYTGPIPENQLNPYAMIIINEARRRGIVTKILDHPSNLFSLSFGGRTVKCRESLTELTNSISLQICSDKSQTHRILKKHGLMVPEQTVASSAEKNALFLERCGSIVVKPAEGEQGAGISVDLNNLVEMEKAILRARCICETVLLEEFIEGEELRVLVIKNEVVAAAIRKPAQIIGNGLLTVKELIEKQSRRRESATGGESSIPFDDETRRCVEFSGLQMDSILDSGEYLNVRKTANLHTGGTLHDVTKKLHPKLIQVCLQAARAINIPVVGFDLMVADFQKPEYRIIEANERPGLANHEPNPTAERFIDLLFPQTENQNNI